MIFVIFPIIILAILSILIILIKINKKKLKRSNKKKIKRSNKKKEFYQNAMLNIYNEPLKPCGNKGMSNGSWDNEGKCSELDGGVHQICIKDISNNAVGFSNKTGQSNWSDQRNGDNHCVCLGAWALYNAQGNKSGKILKCDAIPKAALSENYVSKFSEGWNKWNGNELEDQIKEGVESLVNKCYVRNSKKNKYKGLKKNYCNFAKNVPTLKNSDLYRELC